MKAKLDLIEARLQILIEGSISLLLPRANLRQTLAHELVESMRIHLVTAPDGRIFAPSQYFICINISQGKSWLSDQSFLDELTKTLEQAAKDAGFLFSNKPVIQLTADYNLLSDDLRIEIPSPTQKLSDTSSLSLHLADLHEDLRDITLLHAFLIVNSTYNYRLGQSVVNIGRSKDNHLIIDDLRVSRVHAQLRPIKGRYILFDLNSKGGTFVNDQRISKFVLNPGDVISLAGVLLIYGQDTAPNLSNTTNFTPRPSPGPHPNSLPETDMQLKERVT
jgi:FHA domain/Protein of unknown function (DUF3662)